MLGALRHPVSLAHSAATADMISRGRIVLGMGVGGAFNEAQRQEWKNVGVDSRYRAGRFEELVKIFKPLTRGEMVTFKGEHFSVKDVSIKPVSPQPRGVPVLIAAHGRSRLERQYERVLLGDGAISISDSPQEYAEALGRIRAHAENAGVNYENIEKTFYMTVNISDDREKAFNEADRFLNIYYGMNIWGERWGPWGSPKEVAHRAVSYLSEGANTIIFRFASFDQRKQMDLFLNGVVPYL
jgi:alkanesulfonate monooxygenase SsuD/methylene tetrahydromethanopterin reductase-like flavin-dependent oxidoreductase (luciferase family)